VFFRSLLVYEPGFPTFLHDPGGLRDVQEDTMAAFGPVARALESGDEEEAIARAIDGAAGETGHFDREAPNVSSVHLENARQLGLVFRQTPPVPLGEEDLRGIALPVTVARGERTRACYRIVSDTAARLIPGARHVVVPGVGHLLPEQDPAAFAALVLAHLQG
jgi:pimeloyl-ACP methyl ester carboxylesterase